MDSIVTSLSLSKDLEKKVRDLAQKRGQTKNSLIQEALREYLQRQEIIEIERKMQAKARTMGISSEEDVVDLIHQSRRAKK